MKFSEFMAKAPVAREDLFGDWKQKGVVIGEGDAGKKIAEKLSWMRLRVKRAVRGKEIAVPGDAVCKFARGKVPFAKIGETMVVSDATNDGTLFTIVCGGGEFKIVGGQGAVSQEGVKTKRGKKGKAKEEETRMTPAEIQASTPMELRRGWTNYALLDEINARLADEGVKYWNEHGGKFPKRRAAAKKRRAC